MGDAIFMDVYANKAKTYFRTTNTNNHKPKSINLVQEIRDVISTENDENSSVWLPCWNPLLGCFCVPKHIAEIGVQT